MKRTVPVWVMCLTIGLALPAMDFCKRTFPSLFDPTFHQQQKASFETTTSQRADNPMSTQQQDTSGLTNTHKGRRSMFRAVVVLVNYDPEFNITIEPDFLEIVTQKKLHAPTDSDKAQNNGVSQAWNDAKNEAKAKILKKAADHFQISDAEAMELCLNHSVNTN